MYTNTEWLTLIDWVDASIIKRIQAVENIIAKADSNAELASAIAALRAAPEQALIAVYAAKQFVCKTRDAFDPTFDQMMRGTEFVRACRMEEGMNVHQATMLMKESGNSTAHDCVEKTREQANNCLKTVIDFMALLCRIMGRPKVPAYKFRPIAKVEMVEAKEAEELRQQIADLEQTNACSEYLLQTMEGEMKEQAEKHAKEIARVEKEKDDAIKAEQKKTAKATAAAGSATQKVKKMEGTISDLNKTVNNLNSEVERLTEATKPKKHTFGGITIRR